jgi:uncharacterized protein (DUF1330 family)
MPAYVVTEIDVHDTVRYEDYKKISTASIQAYGGRFVVRGGKVETLEGTWSPKRFVVVEFPTVERAKEWWSSAEYAPGKKLRNETATSQMIVVEGV